MSQAQIDKDQIEAARIVAQARLAAIVESSDDAIVSKNLQGVVQSWNRGAQRIFGWTADEIVGKSITMIIPKDRLEEETHILSRLRAGERVDHFETIRVTKDGRQVEIAAIRRPRTAPEGQRRLVPYVFDRIKLNVAS